MFIDTYFIAQSWNKFDPASEKMDFVGTIQVLGTPV